MIRTIGQTAPTARVSAPVWSGLTEKQDHFAHLVAEGFNYSAAYRVAYDAAEMSPPSVWREAHRLSRNEKVAARIEELVALSRAEARCQAQTRSERVISQLEKMMASSKSDSVRLRAAELLGKTMGMFSEPDQKKRKPNGASLQYLEAKLARLLQNTGGSNSD